MEALALRYLHFSQLASLLSSLSRTRAHHLATL